MECSRKFNGMHVSLAKNSRHFYIFTDLTGIIHSIDVSKYHCFMAARGVVSIDVVLSDIDINQCDEQESSESDDGEGKGLGYASDNLMEFMGTHL